MVNMDGWLATKYGVLGRQADAQMVDARARANLMNTQATVLPGTADAQRQEILANTDLTRQGALPFQQAETQKMNYAPNDIMRGMYYDNYMQNMLPPTGGQPQPTAQPTPGGGSAPPVHGVNAPPVTGSIDSGRMQQPNAKVVNVPGYALGTDNVSDPLHRNPLAPNLAPVGQHGPTFFDSYTYSNPDGTPDFASNMMSAPRATDGSEGPAGGGSAAPMADGGPANFHNGTANVGRGMVPGYAEGTDRVQQIDPDAELRKAQNEMVDSDLDETPTRTEAAARGLDPIARGYSKGTPRVGGMPSPQFSPADAHHFDNGATKVPGKGDGTVDKIPAMLAPGEAVLNRGAAEHVGRDKIAAINAIGHAKMQAQATQPAVNPNQPVPQGRVGSAPAPQKAKVPPKATEKPAGKVGGSPAMKASPKGEKPASKAPTKPVPAGKAKPQELAKGTHHVMPGKSPKTPQMDPQAMQALAGILGGGGGMGGMGGGMPAPGGMPGAAPGGPAPPMMPARGMCAGGMV